MKNIIREYWKVNRFLLILHLSLEILSGAMVLAEVTFMSMFLDGLALMKENKNQIIIYFVSFVLILLLQELISNLSSVLLRKMHYALNEDLMMRVLEKRAVIKYEFIEDEIKLDLITRVNNNILENYEAGYSDIISIIYSISRIICLGYVLIRYSIIFGFLIIIVCVILGYFAKKSGEEEYQVESKLLRKDRICKAWEKILCGRNMENERYLFGYAKFLIEKWISGYCNIEKENLSIMKKWMLRIRITGICVFASLFLYIILLLFDVRIGKITIGLFIALMNAVIDMQKKITWNLTDTIDSLSRVIEFTKDEKIFWSMEEETDSKIDNGSSEFHELKFCNVSFYYPGSNKKILDSLSLKIERGVSYALVGINGAGKSTIIKLILGLYSNYEGEIFLNGIELRKVSVDQRCKIFGMVFQDFAKYDISLKENVCLGREINQQSLLNILEKVGLGNKIDEWKDGINTILGKLDEDGTDLSGGEWQRVAIARGTVMETPFLIMDEPTAALDPRNESVIYNLFGELIEDKTALIVSHRLGITKLVDQIIVLDQGKIVERGALHELLQKKGLFYLMYEKQRRWYCEEM